MYFLHCNTPALQLKPQFTVKSHGNTVGTSFLWSLEELRSLQLLRLTLLSVLFKLQNEVAKAGERGAFCDYFSPVRTVQQFISFFKR